MAIGPSERISGNSLAFFSAARADATNIGISACVRRLFTARRIPFVREACHFHQLVSRSASSSSTTSYYRYPNDDDDASLPLSIINYSRLLAKDEKKGDFPCPGEDHESAIRDECFIASSVNIIID